ncbi:MAG: lamin tail domain-containing protein, partial [Planctomycetales bacterium]
MSNRRSYLQGVISAHVTPSQSFATISGEPRSPTGLNSATLTVAGDDITEYQYRLNGGPFSNSAFVTTPIQLSDLPEGSTNQVSVRGRNSAGVWQSNDRLTESRTWIVQADTPTIRINEVLARNDSAVEHFGTYPDMIELYNESLTAVDVSGMRVTDRQDNPDKYVIPNGTVMAGQTYLILLANSDDGTPGLHTGFSLEQDGDEIYLLDSPANGGQLVDSIEFGHQLADQAAGRMASNGKWFLTNPTLGTINVVQATGPIDMLRINEWLALGDTSAADDFVEVFNPTGEIVDMAGMFLTDKPIGNARMHTFRDATFVGASGFVSFKVDGSRKAGHVDFKLPSAQGHIALLDHWLSTIDHVTYGPQTMGISQGY